MKRLLLVSIMLLAGLTLSGALLQNLPMTLVQPDGSQISCLASGDEFFNYLHDEAGYTIIQHVENGYYYYAVKEGDEIIPSSYRVDSTDPQRVGLTPYIVITKAQYLGKRAAREDGFRDGERAPHFGNLNNLVVYIRFNDQGEFSNPRSYFDAKFNDETAGAASVVNYYDEVSYNNLNVDSYHYPVCESNTNLSYVDSHPRGYYSPYNAATNPIGYTNDSQKTQREHSLLANAVNFIEPQVPTDLEIDADNDNFLDSICFIIKGGTGGWADLLWAHRWYLFSENVYIHGKRVYDYTFQPETQNEVSTLVHEFFHLLGAPDLYHYSDAGGNPNGPYSGWDVMNGAFTHMSAYMKYRYGYWIDSIPEITESGTYWLKPLTSPTNNCYKIASPNSTNEYFVLEFRKKIPGTFENNIPCSGLTISRVNMLLDGQGNPSGPPDELYLYRPGGTNSSSGDIQSAFFSIESTRTEFNDASNPSCFLSNGGDGGINIIQVGSAYEDSISFIFNPQEAFVMGMIASDNPEADVTEAVIQLGNETYDPFAQGDYVITHFQGIYDFEVFLDGHGLFNQEVTLSPETILTVDVDLHYLEVPENLTYELEGNMLTLDWNYTDINHPDFNHFNIYISINGVTFNCISTSEETTHSRQLVANLDYYFYVTAEYSNGESFESNIVLVGITDSDESNIPTINSLMGNYPNPFNPETTISFSVAQRDANISLIIYNVKGQEIKTMVNNPLKSGNYNLIWDGCDDNGNSVSSGIYYYRFINGDFVKSRKMILMK